MDRVQLPDQSQFNNPWLARSTEGLFPEVNDTWMEQTPTVEVARPHRGRDTMPPYYQDSEQYSHNLSCASGMLIGFASDGGSFQILVTEGCG